MVPALGQRLGGLPAPQSADPDTERYLLYAAAVALLDAAGAEHPVVVFLDDLHWADKPSLQLLRHVVANTSTSRLLIIGTYRDAELSAAHPLTEALGALLREPAGVSTLALKGFDDTEVIAFMETAAGHELDDAGVAPRPSGLPGDRRQPLLRGRSAAGTLPSPVPSSRTPPGAGWPTNQRRSISPFPRACGQSSAPGSTVSGRKRRRCSAPRRSSGATSTSTSWLPRRTATKTTCWTCSTRPSVPPWSTSCPMPRAATASPTPSSSTPSTRTSDQRGARACTRRWARPSKSSSVEHGDERLGELARHFFLATRPSDTTKALDYARRAGESALEALAPDDAVRYFSQALDLAAQGDGVAPEVMIDLLIGLGTAQRQAGIASFRETLLEAARSAQGLGDTDRLVAAALANSRGWFSALGQVDTEKVDVIEAALDALPDTDSPERARLLATLCSELHFRSPLERRLALADEAKAVARRLGDQATFVDVVGRCGIALLAPSTLATELADIAEALSAASDLDDPVRPGPVRGSWRDGGRLRWRVRACPGAPGDCACDGGEAQAALGSLAGCHFRDAAFALLQGDTEEAERLATAALEVGTAGGQPDAFGFYGVQLMQTRYRAGPDGRAGVAHRRLC